MADEDYKDWLDKYAESEGIAGDVEKPVNKDTAELQAYADQMGDLGKTPLTPEIAKKSLDTNPDRKPPEGYENSGGHWETDDDGKENFYLPAGSDPGAKSLGTYRGKEYPVEAAGMPEGKYGGDYGGFATSNVQAKHDEENANRIHAGMPTIEEEAHHKARANALRIQKGLPTLEEEQNHRQRENADRIQKGLPTIEEEQRMGGGGHAMAGFAIPETQPTTSFLPNVPGGMGGLGLLNPQQKTAPPVQILGGGGSDEAALARSQPKHQVEGAGTTQGLVNALEQKPDVVAGQPSAEKKDIHFAGGGGTASEATQGTPLQLPAQRVVGGGYVNTTSPEVQRGRETYAGMRNEAQAQDEIDARLANQQYKEFFVKRSADLEAQQRQQATELEKQRASHQKAQDVYEQAQKEASAAKINPDKIFGEGGGGHIMAGIALALGAFGSSLTHTPNTALEIIKEKINSSLEAQKAEAASKHKTADNAYSRLLAATGDERLADSAFKQAGLALAESQAQELGATAKDAELMMGLRNAQAKNQLDDTLYLQSTQARVPGQVVGGIPKEVRDLSAKLQEQSKGTLAPEEALSRAARTLGYNYGGGVGPSWERAGLAGGPGRSAGVQYEAQQNYARLQQLRTQLDEARREVEKGGTLSPSRTANLATLRDAMAAELGYVNAGKSPNETELATAGKMLPEDLNAWNFTGANKAKLDRVIRIVDDKLSHAKTSMGNVGQGRGFEAPASEEENAAGAGATEK